jgi:hypothetical protein
MAKVSDTSRGRTNIRISQQESALVFTSKGVHNSLSGESRQFINNMLSKGEEEAFKGITPEKFWTVVLPAVTYVKMAQYIKEVQKANAPSAELSQTEQVIDPISESAEGEVQDEV